MTTKLNGTTWNGKALISDSYTDQNAQMHAKHSNFGSESDRWADVAWQIIQEYGCTDGVDYGCGKGRFGKVIRQRGYKFDLQDYDPAIEGKDTLPTPADFVLCNDVLEHIEPELVDNVLDHLKYLTKKVGLIGIATKYAVTHTLPDGRNPHLSVHPDDWWEAKLKERFTVQRIAKSHNRVHEYACIVTP